MCLQNSRFTHSDWLRGQNVNKCADWSRTKFPLVSLLWKLEHSNLLHASPSLELNIDWIFMYRFSSICFAPDPSNSNVFLTLFHFISTISPSVEISFSFVNAFTSPPGEDHFPDKFKSSATRRLSDSKSPIHLS